MATALAAVKTHGRALRLERRKATATIAPAVARNPRARTGRRGSAGESVMNQAGAQRRSARVHGPARTPSHFAGRESARPATAPPRRNAFSDPTRRSVPPATYGVRKTP